MACRFAETTRFLRLLWAGHRLAFCLFQWQNASRPENIPGRQKGEAFCRRTPLHQSCRVLFQRAVHARQPAAQLRKTRHLHSSRLSAVQNLSPAPATAAPRPKKPCRRTHRLPDRGSGGIHCCPAGNVPAGAAPYTGLRCLTGPATPAPGCTKAAAVHTVLPGSVSASEDSACRGLTPLRTRSQQICHTSKAERSPPGEQHAGQRTACRLSLWRVWQCVFI